MAPCRRLANEVALAADGDRPVAHLRRALRIFEGTARQGSFRIADRFRRILTRGPQVNVVTFSYSSTVLRALVAARRKIRMVYVSLASPENEGRTMALRLARARVNTCLTTDVDLPEFLAHDSASTRLVLGADQIREKDFVNRAGSEWLVDRCRGNHVPCWVLADTTKFAPRRGMRLEDGMAGWTELLLPRPLNHLRTYRRVLAASPLAAHVRVLTEHGEMTPAQVRRAVGKIAVSPRLHSLLG